MSKQSVRIWTKEDYWGFLSQQKWTMIITVVVIMIVTTLYTYSRPKTYQSSSTFVVDTQKPESTLPEGLAHLQMNRSLAVLETIINNKSFLNSLGDDIQSSFEGSIDKEYIRTLDSRLHLIPTDHRGFYQLRATASSPQLAAKTAQVAMAQLQERCIQRENQAWRLIRTFIRQRKDLVEEKIKETEHAIQNLVKSSSTTGFVPSDRNSHPATEIEQKLTTLGIQTELKTATINAYREVLDSVQEQSDGLLSESSVLEREKKQLDQLFDRRSRILATPSLQDDLSKLDAKIEKQKNRMIQLALKPVTASETSYTGIQPARINQIKRRLLEEELDLYILKKQQDVYRRLLTQNRKNRPGLNRSIELNQLERTRDLYQQHFARLVEQQEETELRASTHSGGIQVLEMAGMPSASIPIPHKRHLALGAYLAVAIALAVALIRHHGDNTIKQESDVERWLQQSVIGVVPRIKRDYSNIQAVEEYYRGLCTQMLLTAEKETHLSLLITSSLPGEGKSLTATNMAINMAEMGKRTLLIDTDLHKPSQHRLLDSRQSPGLSEYVRNRAEIRQIIYPLKEYGLDFIPTGSQRENTTQILAHHKLREFIITVQKAYQVIIVDTVPAITASSDALLMASLIPNTLMVIRVGQTPWVTIHKALNRLKSTPTHIRGVILNGVKDSNNGYITLSVQKRPKELQPFPSKS